MTLALLVSVVGACDGERSSRARETITVFAASSLTAPFEEFARAYESRHPDAKVELHCAGTPQLVLQIENGAEVDVFASADLSNMRRVTDRSQARTTPRLFARNRLVIVVEKGNPKAVHGLTDLARADLRVLLCGPDVPAGRYAREALAKAGTTVSSASDEPNVKSVVAKLRLGEADAGIVYVTDHTGARDRLDAVVIPAEFQIEASYPIVDIASGRNAAGAVSFIDFVVGPEGRAILERFGFSSP